jgi:hypothetical protein
MESTIIFKEGVINDVLRYDALHDIRRQQRGDPSYKIHIMTNPFFADNWRSVFNKIFDDESRLLLIPSYHPYLLPSREEWSTDYYIVVDNVNLFSWVLKDSLWCTSSQSCMILVPAYSPLDNVIFSSTPSQADELKYNDGDDIGLGTIPDDKKKILTKALCEENISEVLRTKPSLMTDMIQYMETEIKNVTSLADTLVVFHYSDEVLHRLYLRYKATVPSSLFVSSNMYRDCPDGFMEKYKKWRRCRGKQRVMFVTYENVIFGGFNADLETCQDGKKPLKLYFNIDVLTPSRTEDVRIFQKDSWTRFFFIDSFEEIEDLLGYLLTDSP